ncbi:MAG: hypothetical protein AAGF12_22645 [Myxococcota bacterium]
MRLVATLTVALGLAGCDTDGSSMTVDAGSGDASTQMGETITHTFEAVEIAAGEEISWVCQSWTLDNEEPIYVNAVRAANGGSWHHSNWFFVPTNTYEGPDGTWPCDDREFTEVGAGSAGGVLFAQSTQAPSDVQQFPEGVAIELPPRAQIVGNVHLLNFSGETMNSAMTFELDVIPQSEVVTELSLVSFSNRGLEIPPRQRSRFSTECDFSASYELPTFRFFYALPHHHELGNYFSLEAIGPDGAQNIIEMNTSVGEAWGRTFDPPIEVTDATALRMTCGYDNPRDEVVRYGIGDQEMCVFLAFTDLDVQLAGFGGGNEVLGEEDGISMNQSNCNGLVINREDF